MIKALLAGLLLVSSPAMAQAKMGWQEDFRVGQNVDLSQGFYVCANSTQGVLAKLIRVENPHIRYRMAQASRCPIMQNPERPAVFRVLAVKDNICLEPKVEEGWTVCGREGHELLIQRPDGSQQVVLWISMDWDVD